GFDSGGVWDKVRAAPTQAAVPQDPDSPLTDFSQTYFAVARANQPAHVVQSYAAYATLEWHVGELRLLPALRIESFAFHAQTRPGLPPPLHGTYDVSKEFRLQLATGLYKKPPAVETFALLDNVNPLITSWQNAVGFDWQITQAISAQVTGYYNYLWND